MFHVLSWACFLVLQALLIQKTHPEKLIDTPFVFKGYEGNDWLMEYDILHTEIDPDPQGVAKVKANPSQLKVNGVYREYYFCIRFFLLFSAINHGKCLADGPCR